MELLLWSSYIFKMIVVQTKENEDLPVSHYHHYLINRVITSLLQRTAISFAKSVKRRLPWY